MRLPNYHPCLVRVYSNYLKTNAMKQKNQASLIISIKTTRKKVLLMSSGHKCFTDIKTLHLPLTLHDSGFLTQNYSQPYLFQNRNSDKTA